MKWWNLIKIRRRRHYGNIEQHNSSVIRTGRCCCFTSLYLLLLWQQGLKCYQAASANWHNNYSHKFIHVYALEEEQREFVLYAEMPREEGFVLLALNFRQKLGDAHFITFSIYSAFWAFYQHWFTLLRLYFKYFESRQNIRWYRCAERPLPAQKRTVPKHIQSQTSLHSAAPTASTHLFRLKNRRGNQSENTKTIAIIRATKTELKKNDSVCKMTRAQSMFACALNTVLA